MAAEKASDLQMPFYMFYVWGFEKVFGSCEWCLRLANLPWFIAGVIAFVGIFSVQDHRRVIGAWLVLFSPFAWYYLDEARPYAMQLGASLLVVTALGHLLKDLLDPSVGVPLTRPLHQSVQAIPPHPNPSPRGKGRGGRRASWQGVYVAMFLLGILVLSGSSLLGMIWAAAAVVTLIAGLGFGATLRLVRQHWPWWLGAGCVLVFLALYYLWTLKVGARASAVAATTLTSTLFIVYELLGFAGLGPGRAEMRSGAFGVLRPYWAGLAAYGFSLAIVLGAALSGVVRKQRGPVKTEMRNTSGELKNPELPQKGAKRHKEIPGLQAVSRWAGPPECKVLGLGLCCVLPVALILIAGRVAHFRVLGRHFTPLVPCLLLVLSTGLSALWSRRGYLAGLAVALFCSLSLLSCLSLRYAQRHNKEDYRAAAAVARAALQQGRSVWWNAAEAGASYYGVPVAVPARAGAALLCVNPDSETLARLSAPQIVIASRPDVYDAQGALARYMREEGFAPVSQYTAFVIWERQPRK
jgi:hypothetical protein